MIANLLYWTLGPRALAGEILLYYLEFPIKIIASKSLREKMKEHSCYQVKIAITCEF